MCGVGGNVSPFLWLGGRLARILSLVKREGVWLEGNLDAQIAMVPEVDGAATPLGQRPLCAADCLYAVGLS